MKKNALFEKCLANVDPAIKEEVSLNVDIANRIYDLLKAKNMTQREFAAKMGKKEPEISRWLSGSHGFTTKTLAKISAVLGEPIVEVKRQQENRYIFLPITSFVTKTEVKSAKYRNNKGISSYTVNYN